MSKVEKAPTTTAMTAAPLNPADYLPTTPEHMDDGIIAPSDSKFLPFMEMVFPIMATPEKPHYRGNDYKVGFVNGSKFEAFPVGTILTVFDKRNAARKGSHDDPNKVYAYSSVDRAGKSFNATADKFQELLAESKSDKAVLIGYSFVIGVLLPDGRAALVDFSAFKTVAPYFYGPLSPALFARRTGLRLDIEDHTANLTKSKTNNYYPDTKKFRQWEEVQLTAAQVGALMDVFKSNEAGYMTWLNK